MTRRIFQSICAAAISVFLLSVVLIMGLLYDYFSQIQQNQMKVQVELAIHGIANEGMDYFKDLDTGAYRITWIGKDGAVLYDTKSESSFMENHLDREEVREALRTGYGESLRYSSTLTERLLYVAEKLPDGTVVRLAGAQYTVWALLFGSLQPILIVAVAAVIVSFVLASRLSKNIVRPLNELNLDEPETNKGYQELQPLLERIRNQQRQLRLQSVELQRKQDEFDAATCNMKEGLVLLNDQGIILSINRMASKLLSISSYCIGKDILMLNNSLELQELLRMAKSGEQGKAALRIGDVEYQMRVSPVVSGEELTGIVLLIFDITEKEKGEQMRREFTANVSHELKTPLHSISGYAELLKNGMVKTEDIGRFSERIYSEAQRMIALVDDIINLSRLDEGMDDMQQEEVDLYALAESVVIRLQSKAWAAKVSLTLSGEKSVLNGIPPVLSSIIFNLCDNAIQYNRENGSVSVEVMNEKDTVILSVSDTGIGIPKEHQERVFERFYRVDKSHSKEVGGTGLGLSIVKHGARLHHASIELHSVVDGGTTVMIRFPK